MSTHDFSKLTISDINTGGSDLCAHLLPETTENASFRTGGLYSCFNPIKDTNKKLCKFHWKSLTFDLEDAREETVLKLARSIPESIRGAKSDGNLVGKILVHLPTKTTKRKPWEIMERLVKESEGSEEGKTGLATVQAVWAEASKRHGDLVALEAVEPEGPQDVPCCYHA